MSGVVPVEAGVASGLITRTQQIGGALGVVVLSTIAVSATTRFIDGHCHAQGVMTEALNHGFCRAFWIGARSFARIGCLVAFFGMVGIRPTVAPASEHVTDDPRTAFEPAS
jgi:hypothetical protein